MIQTIRTDVFDFRTEPAARKAEALGRMCPLIEELFEGPGVGPLCAALRSGDIHVFKLALYYAGADPVGFALVVHDVVELDGRAVVVGRAFTGMRRQWRGQQRSLGFFLRTGLDMLRHHRGTPLWAFVPAMHISSYRVIALHVPGVVPHPDRALSDAERRWIDALADRFGCERAPGDHPLVCRRPLRVRGAGHTPPPTARPEDALDRFFTALNPAHAEGGCVMTLAPITPATLLGALGRWTLGQLRRTLRPRAALKSSRTGAVSPG